MKGKRYTEQQIVRMLQEIDGGQTVAETCRQYGVSEATVYRWKRRRRGIDESELRRGAPWAQGAEVREQSSQEDRTTTGAGHRRPERPTGKRAVSPQAKRRYVRRLQTEHAYSERQACALVGVARSTARYQATTRPDEQALRTLIRELANRRKRHGCPRITHLLHRAGVRVNKKRVNRLWKDEGLQLPRRKVKKRRVGPKGEVLMRAQHSSHVWSYDFIHDRTERGGQIRILSVLDEFSRQCLALLVGRSITSKDVIHLLEWLFQQHGAPKHLRSDNGPEFIAHAVRRSLPQQSCDTIYITPGSPWENFYIESFFDKLRQECLNCKLIGNVQVAQSICEQWRQEYNQYRPRSSLNYMTPDEFVRQHQAICSEQAVIEPRPEGTRTDESGGGEFVRSHLPIPLHRNDERQLDRAQSVWHDTYVE